MGASKKIKMTLVLVSVLLVLGISWNTQSQKQVPQLASFPRTREAVARPLDKHISPGSPKPTHDWRACAKKLGRKMKQIKPTTQPNEMSDSFSIASGFELSFVDSLGKPQSWSLADVIARSAGSKNPKDAFRFDSKFISALKGKHKNFHINNQIISFFPDSHIAVRVDSTKCQVVDVLIGTNDDYHPLVSKLIRAHIHVSEDSPSLCSPIKCNNGKNFIVSCPPSGSPQCLCYECYKNYGYHCSKMGSSCWATVSHGTTVATKVTCTAAVCAYKLGSSVKDQCHVPACSAVTTTCPFFVKPCHHVSIAYVPPKAALSMASTLGTSFSMAFSVLGGLTGYFGGGAEMKLAFTLLGAIAKGTAFGAKLLHKKAHNPMLTLETKVATALSHVTSCVNVKLSKLPARNLIGEINTLQTKITDLGHAKTLADEFQFLFAMLTTCNTNIQATIQTVWGQTTCPSCLYMSLQPIVIALRGCASIYATYIRMIAKHPSIPGGTTIGFLRTALRDLSTLSHNMAVYAMIMGYREWNVACEKSHPNVRTQYHILLKKLRKSTLDPLLMITSGGMGGQVFSGFVGRYASYPLTVNVDPTPIVRPSPKGFPGCIQYCVEDVNCTSIELVNMNTCKLYKSGSVDLAKAKMGTANYQMNARLQTAVVDRTMAIAQVRFLVWNNWGKGMNIPIALWLKFPPPTVMPLYNRVRLKTEAECTHLCATTTGCIVSSFYATWCDNLGFHSLRRMRLPPRIAPMYMGAHVIFKNARVTKMDKMYWKAPAGSYKKVTVMWEYACLAACAYTNGCIAVDYSTRYTGECRLFHASQYSILQNMTVTYNPSFRHYHVYSRLTRLYPALTLPMNSATSLLPSGF